MHLHPIDVTIVIAHLLAVIGLGWFLSRHAGKDLEAYYLGGKGVPWYLLGISHGVSGLDVSGMMWFALMLFTYGVKGVYLLWIWPMFTMVFRMVYLGIWIRRSNVLTGAEWMHTRFSRVGGGEWAHLSVVLYAVVGVVGFLSYAFQGIGKFAAPFFPWGFEPATYATVILFAATACVVAGGMYSVVATDLLQYVLLTVSAIGAAVLAFRHATPEQIAAAVPAGWGNLSCGWVLDIDWSARVPLLQRQIERDGGSLFAMLLTMLLLKGWLVSMAGPGPGYGIQRVLATRNPKEAALASWWISVSVLAVRFLLIASMVVLALVQLSPQLRDMRDEADFEQVLPLVVRYHVPIGLAGIVVAALVAAFLSTFDSTVHAGTAYLVNDVYKRYVHREASPKTYVTASYVVSVALVLVGIGFGFLTESINSVTHWLVSMLFGGYTAPNLLKWHWWRFNGYGFFAGLLAGVAAAIAIPLLWPAWPPLHAFPAILAVSSLAAVAVCLLTPAESTELLDEFYLTIRPWGFWGPVHRRLLERYPDLARNHGFLADMINCAVGIVWQTAIALLPIYFVLRNYGALAWTGCCVAATSCFLKRCWYDRLGAGDGYLPEDPRHPQDAGD